MSYPSLFVIFVFVFNIFSMSCALKIEKIVGGYRAFEGNHKYHAAIIGKYYHTNVRYFICNGAIIAEYYTLSAAHCFITKGKAFIKLTFFVLLAAIRLTRVYPNSRKVETIYTLDYTHKSTVNDLAVVKLKDSLFDEFNVVVSSLEIPEPDEKFEGVEATVTGFGVTNFSASGDFTKYRQSITDWNVPWLTYAFPKISKDEDCEKAYTGVAMSLNHMCGVIKPDMNHQHRGLCTNDGGSPLVYEDKVIGIATKNRPDCDDTRNGSIYTRTSIYKAQIDAIVAGNPLEVSALKTEKIVGGYPAFEGNYKYQAAIMGKYMNSNVRYLICSGAIIADLYILSAAHCFIVRRNALIKLSIFVLVGSTKLSSNEPVAKDVDKIYTLFFEYNTAVNDLAILKLKESLQLLDNVLASVKVPEQNETFADIEGRLTGYGAKKIDESRLSPKTRQIISDNNIANLTYAFAKISRDEACDNAYLSASSAIHLCGVIKKDWKYDRRGLCTSDGGAPLVYDGKVVGIALKNRPSCDDTRYGGVYTRTSFYKSHIDAVLAGNPLESMRVFDNPQHFY